MRTIRRRSDHTSCSTLTPGGSGVTHLLSPGRPDTHVDTAAYRPRPAHLAALRPQHHSVPPPSACIRSGGWTMPSPWRRRQSMNPAEPGITQQGFPHGPQSHRATVSMPQVVDVAR